MKSSAVTSSPDSLSSADLSRIELFSFGSAEKSKGSIFIAPEVPLTSESAGHYAQFLKTEFHLCALLHPPSMIENVSDFENYVDSIAAALEREKLKRLTAVGVGANAIYLLALTARHRELIRRVLLISPRLPAVSTGGLLGMIDRFIPFGLPLKFQRSARDIRTYSHRIRCPSLVLHAPDENAQVRAQSDALAARMPNARTSTLKYPLLAADQSLSLEVCKHVREFMDVPAKRSQKNS